MSYHDKIIIVTKILKQTKKKHKTTDQYKCWQDMEKWEPSSTVGGNV